MKLVVLLFLIAVPLAEIAAFIAVGDVIGILPTIALVILGTIIGIALLKRQGLAALERARRSAEAGEAPVGPVVDGVCLLVAGVLLLIPGLITDVAGFLLLAPPVRHALGYWIVARVRESGAIRVWTAGSPAPPGGRPGGSKTIDGEYEDVTPEPRDETADRRLPRGKPDPESPWRQ